MVINDLTTAIILLFVGVAVLLIGMRTMSGGLKKLAGPGLKRFFNKTKDNPFAGLGIGTAVTAVIQSSDATNAMVVGFLNAGAMTLYQGLCIMLGAYIGTTVTGILASFSSFSISLYFLLLIFIGVVLLFIHNEKVNNVGEILAGLGLLFLGLALMSSSFKNADINAFCQDMFKYLNNGVLLFLIGILLAALVQSSSAVTSIVIAMVGGSALGLGAGLYIVLGATLGTVTNTILASIGGGVKGKRAAFIAFSLRTITSVIMLIFLLCFESGIANLMHCFAINGSDQLPIAMFTVFYNIIFMPLCIPFLNLFIKLSEKVIKDKQGDKLSKCIKHIDDKLLVNPSIALMQAKKEIINMFELSRENYINGFKMVTTQNLDDTDRVIELEDQVDYLNKRITDFLIALSNKVYSDDDKVIGAYFHVINDIERIGDHAYNFYEMTKEMKNEELKFSSLAVKELNEMNDVILTMFDLSEDIFIKVDKLSLTRLHELETKTDELKIVFSTNHYKRITSKSCSSELTPFISSLIVELERVADHLTNIGYSVDNPTGDE